MSRTRITTLPFLLLALSPFVIFICLSYFLRYLPLLYLTVIIIDFVFALCQTPFGIFFMILGRNVEQDQTTCRVQE